MTKQHSNKQSSQPQQTTGQWASGKVDIRQPDVAKSISAAKQTQAEIIQQKQINAESLKRIVCL